MPVFGKESRFRKKTEKRRQQFLGKDVVARGVKLKRSYKKRFIDVFEMTFLSTIETCFPQIFGKRFSGRDFIEERHRLMGRPVVVLDFGCGTAVTIEQVADKYGEKVAAYGSSIGADERWANVKNVKLIQATQKGILRYLKNNSIDLIYSHLGLGYLFPSEPDSKKTIPGGVAYIKKLLEKVSENGKIVFDLYDLDDKKILAELKKQLGTEATIIQTEQPPLVLEKFQ
jgi:precorrin-6B methylase 2